MSLRITKRVTHETFKGLLIWLAGAFNIDSFLYTCRCRFINGAWGVGGTLAKLDTGAASTVRDSSLEQDPGGKVRRLLSYDSLFS